jgi:hypothetical protein
MMAGLAGAGECADFLGTSHTSHGDESNDSENCCRDWQDVQKACAWIERMDAARATQEDSRA